MFYWKIYSIRKIYNLLFIRDLSCVFSLSSVSTYWWRHVPLFHGILRTLPVVLYNGLARWLERYFFLVLKTIFYPSKISFLSWLRHLIFSTYLTPVNGVLKSGFWFLFSFGQCGDNFKWNLFLKRKVGATERPGSLNPSKAIAVAICPIIDQFST